MLKISNFNLVRNFAFCDSDAAFQALSYEATAFSNRLGHLKNEPRLSPKGVTTEYPITSVLNFTANLFLKKYECPQINYRQLWGLLYLS